MTATAPAFPAAAETITSIVSGYMDDGYHYYVPGVNCLDCGRFVGRDGWIEIECFEMSAAVAAVSGQCAACCRREAATRD